MSPLCSHEQRSERLKIFGSWIHGNGYVQISQRGAEHDSSPRLYQGGSINLNARNINLSEGSQIRGGLVATDLVVPDAEAGDVIINASDNITIDGISSVTGFNSGIFNTVNQGAVGDGRNINITTNELSLDNGATISAGTSGEGNAGNIDIQAQNSVSLSNSSFINSTVNSGAVGDGGDIALEANSLTLTEGSQIQTGVFGATDILAGGVGNAGNVNLKIGDTFTASGFNEAQFSSGVFTIISLGAEGNGGEIDLTTRELSLNNGAIINAATFGQGDTGVITINANTLSFDGVGGNGISSGILNTVNPGGVGNARGINITTNELSLDNGATISAGTFGEGNAGNIDIQAQNSVSLFNSSFINSTVNSGAVGDGGDIAVEANFLTLTEGSQIQTGVFGTIENLPGGVGDAGNVNLKIGDTFTASGFNEAQFSSGVFTIISLGAEGNGGEIDLTTRELSLNNGGIVNAATFGQGDTGVITINANTLSFDGVGGNGISSGILNTVNQGAVGDGRNINITTTELSLDNGATISAGTFGQGKAGNIDIQAQNSVSLSNSSFINSTVNSGAVGDGGDIAVEANSLTLTEGSQIQTGVFETVELDGMTIPGGKGDAGNVNLKIGDTFTASGFDEAQFNSGIFTIISPGAEGNGGEIDITTGELSLTNGGIVNAATSGQGDTGAITINADSLSLEGVGGNGFASGIFNTVNQGAVGDGRNINITTNELSLDNGAAISAGSFGDGDAGQLIVKANSLRLNNNANIDASTTFEEGEGGIINLQITEDVILENDSFISAQAFGEADGGNLNIDARYIVAFPSRGTGNDLVAAADEGRGGNINLNVEQLFGLRSGDAIDRQNNFIPNKSNDIDVSGNIGGNLTINTTRVNNIQEPTELPQNIVEPEQTIAQACQANRVETTQNTLTIEGKGGIFPEPGLPLNSQNIIGDNENSNSAIPAPIETAQGKIQLARGIKVNEDGTVILTAYRTNNAGDRLPETNSSCNGV